jgi:hypothetical protein
LYDAAGSPEHIKSAAHVVSRAFLAVDGNLQRANEFLQYQRFGPNGPDGKPDGDDNIKTNHLAGVTYPTRSDETNKAFENALAQLDKKDGKSRNDYRAKGFIYLYWGKPTDGAKQFYQAFKAAKLEEIPAAAQELAIVGIKAKTASLYGLDKVFEYINHSTKGKDGKQELTPFKDL